jgi:hypothetical protein
MAQRPKKHHYVPKSYLAGFTPSGSVDDALWVHQVKTGKSRQSKPEACAFEREYYGLTSSPEAYSALESHLAEIEGTGIEVVREIVAENKLPAGDRLSTLLDYVAVMSTRGPRSRDSFDAFLSEVNRKRLIIAKHYAAQARGEVPDKASTTPSQEEIDELKKEELGPDHKLMPFLDGVDVVRQTLQPRHWSLWRTRPDTQRLITSDNPVSVNWMDPPPDPLHQLPGFGQTGTILRMPLSRSHLLVGCFEAPLESGEPMPIEMVAAENTMRLMLSRREVYSFEEAFPLVSPEHKISDYKSVVAAAITQPGDMGSVDAESRA